jgi:hypothetical protein
VADDLQAVLEHPVAKKPTPDEFLSAFPSEIQALANQLRGLVKETIPSVREAVYTGWKLIGYRVKKGKREA